MLKLGDTISNTLSLWGQVSPLGQTCPMQALNLTQIDNLLRNCVNEIFVTVARL